MSDKIKTSSRMSRLLWAGLLETLCFLAGAIAWSLTGSWAWIVIGLVAGAGFSLPAIIVFLRDSPSKPDGERR